MHRTLLLLLGLLFVSSNASVEECKREFVDHMEVHIETLGLKRTRDELVGKDNKMELPEETLDQLCGAKHFNWQSFTRAVNDLSKRKREVRRTLFGSSKYRDVTVGTGVSDTPECTNANFLPAIPAFPTGDGSYGTYLNAVNGQIASACEGADVSSAAPPAENATAPVLPSCPGGSTGADASNPAFRCNADFVAPALILSDAIEIVLVPLDAVCNIFPSACVVQGVFAAVQKVTDIIIDQCDFQCGIVDSVHLDAGNINSDTIIEQLKCARAAFEDIANNRLEHKRVHLDVLFGSAKNEFIVISTERGEFQDVVISVTQIKNPNNGAPNALPVTGGQLDIVNLDTGINFVTIDKPPNQVSSSDSFVFDAFRDAFSFDRCGTIIVSNERKATLSQR